jgi:hypothetical protein
MDIKKYLNDKREIVDAALENLPKGRRVPDHSP